MHQQVCIFLQKLRSHAVHLMRSGKSLVHCPLLKGHIEVQCLKRWATLISSNGDEWFQIKGSPSEWGKWDHMPLEEREECDTVESTGLVVSAGTEPKTTWSLEGQV